MNKYGIHCPNKGFQALEVPLVTSFPESLVSDYRGALPTRPGAQPYPLREGRGEIEGVALHWADATGRDYTPEEIARYQTGPSAHLAFPRVAYHLMVRQDGEIAWLLPLEAIPWHVGPRNRQFLSILAQPPKGNMWTEAQISSLKRLVPWLEVACGKRLAIKLHRDLAATACPGPLGERLLAALQEKGQPDERKEVVQKARKLLAQADALLERL